jgi:signal transduction histidine kinase
MQQFLPGTLAALCEAIDGRLAALVMSRRKPIIARRGLARIDLEKALVAEARSQPEPTSAVGPPAAAGDSGWATVHVPVVLREQRIGTLSALRMRGEPFRASEQQALGRLASLLALALASERYQQQRARFARLEERQRIADHLHDDVAQLMFAAQLHLERLMERDDLDASAADGVTRTQHLIGRCDTRIRSVIDQLTPQRATTDLPHRLEVVVADVQQEFDVAVHLAIAPPAVAVAKRIPRPAVEALVKVARESLINAAKHAGPCRATVTLDTTPDELRLAVLDDGVGVCGRGRGEHHGLASLRRAISNQGGTLNVSGGATGGTRIVAVVPQ